VAEPSLTLRLEALDLTVLQEQSHRFLCTQPRTFQDLRAHLKKRNPKLDERDMGYAVRTQLPLIQKLTRRARTDLSQEGRALLEFVEPDARSREVHFEKAH
jgi:hypothetical protein